MVQTGRAFFICIFIVLFGVSEMRSQDTTGGDGYRKFYYPGGKISGEGLIRGGKPDGYWKAYNPDGSLKSEGNRKNFELDSLWKFYNETGKLLLEINYRNGKKNGIKTTYLDKETIRENYVNDLKEGYTRYYFQNGRLKQEIPFEKGLEQGFAREFAADGTIITLTEYKRGFIVDRQRINRRDGKGQKQGKWYTFYDNGRFQSEATYRNDVKNGYFKEYAENGDLLRITKYINGEVQREASEIQKLDITNEYYPNGKVRISVMSRNGIREGTTREYDTAGVVIASYLYSNGIVIGEGIIRDDGNRHGLWKDYYSDGTLRAQGQYDNGKQTGEWKFYHQNGKIEQTGKYGKSGKPDGTWKWYYETGELLREENYRAGVRDGLVAEYDETGKTILEGEYLEGNEDGPWFEITGDCYIRGEYRDGLRSGTWQYILLDTTAASTDSITIYRGAFIEDNPNGKHTWYWENGKVKDEGTYVMGNREGEWFKYNYDGTLFMVITYRQGVEVRYDGVKIKPPYEKEE